MAVTISKISVRIAANSDGVTPGITSAEGKFERFQKRINKLGDAGFGRLKSFASSAFATTTAAIFTADAAGQAFQFTIDKVGESIERIGGLADRAAAAGIGANDLGKLEYVAQFAGVDEATLGASVQRMHKAIDAALSDGGSQQALTLKSLGLDLNALGGLDAHDQFLAIGEAIDAIEDPTQRVAVAMELFGKSGGKLLPVFGMGADSIAAMEAEAVRLGIALSEEDVAAIDEVGDAMARLAKIGEGFFNQLAAESAPKLLEAIEKTADGVIFLGDSLDDLSAFAVKVQPLTDALAALLPATLALSAVDLGLDTAGAYGEVAKLETKPAIDPRANDEAGERAIELEEERLDAIKKAEEERAAIMERTHERLASRAESIRESLRDPFDALAAELAGVLDAVDEGVLSQLDYEKYAAREGQALLERLDAERQSDPLREAPTTGIGSVTAGSQEALSAIAGNDRAAKAQAERERAAARVRKQQLGELQQIRRILAKPRVAAAGAEIF